MRDDIVKYLGTVAHSTAKAISERIGLERGEVSLELNRMHAEALVEREKRGGGGNEYVYWLVNSATVTQTEIALPKVQNEPPPMPPVAAAKPEVQSKLSAIEQDRDRLQAEVLDLRITASNQREKIRVLEAQRTSMEASIKQDVLSVSERYDALIAEHQKEHQRAAASWQATITTLSEEIETLREQIAAAHRPIGASVAEALKPFLLPGQKIIWREPFRWHDDEGVMPNHYEGMSVESLAESFGYRIVVNCELAAIIQLEEVRKSDEFDVVASAEAAGVR